MNCLKCNKNLIEVITFKKKLFSYYKVYTLFCVGCEFEKVKEIKISKDDYLSCLEERTLKAKNTTQKTYSQNFKRGVLN